MWACSLATVSIHLPRCAQLALVKADLTCIGGVFSQAGLLCTVYNVGVFGSIGMKIVLLYCIAALCGSEFSLLEYRDR